MNRNEKKLLMITCLICLFPILIGLFFYNRLPNEIAIHFNVHNQPDGYFHKNMFVFGLPILMCVFQIIAFIGDIKQNNQKEANKKMTQVARWIIPILTVCMYVATSLYALENSIDMRKVCMILIGVLFIVIGNYLPKTKHSKSVHFGFSSRLNDLQYKKIARIYGYSMMIIGFLFLLSIFFDVWVSVSVLVLLFVETIGIVIYTYRLSKYEK